MSKKCDLCDRVATRGATRSHSKVRTLKRQGINLQPRVIGGIKVKLCTSCLRTMSKDDRMAEKKAAKPAKK